MLKNKEDLNHKKLNLMLKLILFLYFLQLLEQVLKNHKKKVHQILFNGWEILFQKWEIY